MSISRRQLLSLVATATFLGGCETWTRKEDSKTNAFAFDELKISNSLIKMEYAVLNVLPYRQHLLEDAWDQIDQQSIEFETRKNLELNGYRVGVTGFQLPPNLSLLLQPPAIDKSKLTDIEKGMVQAGVAKAQDLRERHVKISLQPNKTKDLKFGSIVPEMTFQWNSGNGFVRKSFQSVETCLRLVAQQTAGRSIQLGIIPFLLHGNKSARYEAKENNFEMSLGRRQELVSEASMKLPVSLGQTVILGPTIDSLTSEQNKFGHVFFGKEGKLSLGNRIVLLRLIHAGNSELFGDRVRGKSLVNDI